MELVKREDHWALYNEDGHKIAATITGCNSKLSIKNCEAIECGYDLDELARQEAEKLYNKSEQEDDNIWEYLVSGEVESIKIGFQKALELLGDKKYSKEDLEECYSAGWVQRHKTKGSYYVMRDEFIQSLQQTEFDVEIEMEEPHSYKMCSNPKDHNSCLIPKLDANKCLILKRI